MGLGMFKVGAKYKFHMLENGGEVTFGGTIETYEHPLIKLEDTRVIIRSMDGGEDQSNIYPGAIINVTSPNFVSAVEKID